MEGNTQTPQPTTTPPPSVSPVVPAPTPKYSPFPILFVVLILILLTATGVFAYQNMQLQKQIVILQSQPTPTPLPTEAPAKEGDPTANWRIYRDQKYEFKYQDYWKSEASADDSKQLLSLESPTEMNMSLSLIENLSGLGLECEVETDQQQITINQSTVTKIYTSGVKDDSCGDNSAARNIWVSLIPSGGDYLILRYNTATVRFAESAFDQILSTFTFLDQNVAQ